MSASIAPAKRKRIEKRRADGERMNVIAVAEGVSESTVRRVCRAVDDEVRVVGTPAQVLTAQDVAFVQEMARSYTALPCPRCREAMLMRKGLLTGACEHCGNKWVRTLPTG